MSNTICFDRVSEAKNILKSGIGNKSISARSDLRTAAWYLLTKTTYTKRQIEERLRLAAEDYFRGMSDDYITSSIRDVISSVKDAGSSDRIAEAPVSIIIYQEELEKIESLKHDDTERLAFVFLCAAKMLPYRWIYECNAELYRLAWRYKYDTVSKKVLGKQQGRRVGGIEPTKRVNRICQAGIVHYITRINTSYKLTHSAPPASASFTVPILCDSGEVAFVINKPDMESLVLYYDRYKGYSGLITCQCCGRPALRTGRRHKYCISCADDVNHNPEKRDLCTN